MKRLVYIAALLPLTVFAQGGLPTQPYIYVEGKAEVEKPADMATLRFDVVSRSPDEKKANADVQAKANAVFDLVKSRGIANADVLAESLRSQPQFENGQDYSRKGKLIGYEVSRSFQVKVRDMGTFPKLADDVIAIGGIEFSSIDSGLQKQEEIEKGNWTKAVANAREEADKTLQPMGMRVDSVFAVSPVPIPQITTTMFPKDENGSERVVVTGSNIPTAQEVGPRPSQYRLAPVTVTQVVHVVFLTAPAK